MNTLLKNIRDNNVLMAVVILLAYYLIVKLLKYLVKLVHHERYTNQSNTNTNHSNTNTNHKNTNHSSFLQKQLENFRNKRNKEGFANKKEKFKIGTSTNNIKTNNRRRNNNNNNNNNRTRPPPPLRRPQRNNMN